ncbi:adhesin, partial [Pseudomonas sp. p50]|uniref:immunoglobulin-like domain-containing protein n=1 Tax=Pseudomonas sp. p50(2008) TaxID=2816832 RepID=UPI0019D833DF
FAAGETSKVHSLTAQGDDVYKDGETVELGVSNVTSGGTALENLVIGNPGSVVVSDTPSEVVATLTADKTTVAEGGQITYTVTLTNAAGLPINNHGELTFTLTDGTVVTVPANGTSGSFTITAPDDILVGGQPTIVNKLESVEGAGNFEQLTLGQNSLETTVTDEPGTGTPTDNQGDKVAISIVGNGPVLENQAPSFTITLDKAQLVPLTVTLSNGQTVTFAAGETSKVHSLTAQGDDVYKDGETVELGVSNVTSGGTALENLVIGNPGSVVVSDTPSEVVATLTADKTTVAEGGQITYTVTLTNAAGLPINNHGELTFTLTDGTVVTVPANGTSGSFTITAPDDVLVGGQPTIVNKLESVTGADNFEQLTLGQGKLETTVTDEPGTGTPTDNQGDKVAISIVGNGPVLENQAPSFTITLDKAQLVPLTVTLSNGQTVTFAAGETSKVHSLTAQGDDVYKDGETVELGVSNVTSGGTALENLVIGNPGSVVVSDTPSEVVATLTADKTTVAEGGQITYTVTLTNAAGLPINNHGELSFTLTDGTVVTVPANSTSGSFTITAPDDILVGGQPTIVNKLESVTGADNFEQLTLGQGKLETTVTDEPGTGTPTDNQGDKVAISIVGNGPVLENQAPSFTITLDKAQLVPLTVT